MACYWVDQLGHKDHKCNTCKHNIMGLGSDLFPCATCFGFGVEPVAAIWQCNWEAMRHTYQEITGEKIRLKLGAEPKKESEIRMIPALCPGCNKPIEICTGQFRLCVNCDHVKYPDPIWDPVKLRWADLQKPKL